MKMSIQSLHSFGGHHVSVKRCAKPICDTQRITKYVADVHKKGVLLLVTDALEFVF